MDALGAAEAVLALALLPGGLLLASAGWLGAAAAGRRGLWSLGPREVVVLLLTDLAVAQAPLPGSPITTLPPGQGAAPDIAVVALLIAAAVATATSERRPGWPWVIAGTLSGAALTVALGAASLSLPAITGHPGASMLAARAAVAVAVLVAAPALTWGSRLSPPGEATLLAGLGLLGLSLLSPPALPAWQAALATALAAVAAAAYAGAVLRWRARLASLQVESGVACLAAGAAAVAAVLVGTLG
ncbi:MAG TPA: hypothetical protein VF155_04010 [Candidatus Dormibacteraeota bacterium]